MPSTLIFVGLPEDSKSSITSPTPLIKYPIPSQKAENAPVTFLRLRVFMGGGDRLLSNDSPACLSFDFTIKKELILSSSVSVGFAVNDRDHGPVLVVNSGSSIRSGAGINTDLGLSLGINGCRRRVTIPTTDDSLKESSRHRKSLGTGTDRVHSTGHWSGPEKWEIWYSLTILTKGSLTLVSHECR
ncbi:hypothetical protein EVAR_51159_1 [Eumeta japonica]|uniref:Uncharacterized protein n=1 Tax=Eumeta variegata TaxID=151549 RepID=A0A4C1XFJ1_EUMVA|nr:hypothetical protein EVAR_51159_1 [Eumeta japonica]